MDTVPGNRIIGAGHRYQRHQSETTPLYPIVEQQLPALRDELQRHEVQLPRFVLTASTTTYAADDSNMGTCGASLRHTLRATFGRANRQSCRFVVRVKCNGCRDEHLVAFSCKRRGFCPSCGARRMIETLRHLERKEAQGARAPPN